MTLVAGSLSSLAKTRPEVSSKWVGLYSFRLRSSFLKVTLHFLIFFFAFSSFCFSLQAYNTTLYSCLMQDLKATSTLIYLIAFSRHRCCVGGSFFVAPAARC